MRGDEVLYSSQKEEIPLLNGLNQEEQTILRQYASEENLYKKGDIVFMEGDTDDNFYFMESGLVKLSKISADGKEQIIRFFFPNEIFGEHAILKNVIRYGTTEVVSPSKIYTITKNDFMTIMTVQPMLFQKIIVTLISRLEQADEWVTLLSLMGVEERLARVILYFYEKSQPKTDSFQLPIFKKDLASFIGTTPETLSRKLSSLVHKGLIVLSNGDKITIKNYWKIREAAGL